MIHSTTNYIHHKKPSLAKAKSSNTGYGKPIHPDMTKFGITSGHTETRYKLYLLNESPRPKGRGIRAFGSPSCIDFGSSAKI